MPLGFVDGQENEAPAVISELGKPEIQGGFPEKTVGHLDENAGAVAARFIAPHSPPVGKVDQNLKRIPDDIVGFFPLDIAGHTEAAGIVLHVGMIEPLRHPGLIPPSGRPAGSHVGPWLVHETVLS